MTCQEFLSFVGRDPVKMTRAERSAMFAHYKVCPSCLAEFDRRDAEAIARGVRASLSYEEARRLAIEQASDPELPEYRAGLTY